MSNDLLIKVAENKNAAGHVASAVAINFDKLPENARNELLLKVLKVGVFLPQNVRNKLFRK
jgi:hypothetical protein